MKAIILAAGTGSRLMPLTAEKPKCMVKLAGRPLLHRQIETLRGAGVDVIILVGGYRSDQCVVRPGWSQPGSSPGRSPVEKNLRHLPDCRRYPFSVLT